MDIKKLFGKIIKSKLNIAILSIQILAILLFCLMSISVLFLMLGCIIQGVCFILFGVKIMAINKKIFEEYELVQTLLYNPKQLEDQKKKTYITIKNNRFLTIAFIGIGVFLIFISFTYLV